MKWNFKFLCVLITQIQGLLRGLFCLSPPQFRDKVHTFTTHCCWHIYCLIHMNSSLFTFLDSLRGWPGWLLWKAIAPHPTHCLLSSRIFPSSERPGHSYKRNTYFWVHKFNHSSKTYSLIKLFSSSIWHPRGYFCIQSSFYITLRLDSIFLSPSGVKYYVLCLMHRFGLMYHTVLVTVVLLW